MEDSEIAKNKGRRHTQYRHFRCRKSNSQHRQTNPLDQHRTPGPPLSGNGVYVLDSGKGKLARNVLFEQTYQGIVLASHDGTVLLDNTDKVRVRGWFCEIIRGWAAYLWHRMRNASNLDWTPDVRLDIDTDRNAGPNSSHLPCQDKNEREKRAAMELAARQKQVGI